MPFTSSIKMIYPNLVYKVPGSNFGVNGKTYDWKQVNSDAELEDLKSKGWFENLHVACGVVVEPKVAVEEVKAVEIPIELPIELPNTRKDLEEKCKALGIKVDGRMKDDTLLKLIDGASNVVD